ncbi:MAG: signal peptidase II [Oscillospiraceae bacterium]|jgi:signal peptidase II|nr:signal peptidase II [Oscillospiraceae bacterium]
MVYAIVLVIVLIIDQAVKTWTISTLPLGGTLEFIPKLVELTHVQNRGAAFGLLSGSSWARWVFVALTIVMCIVIVVVLANDVIKARPGRWLLVMIMAGGLGNCIDRAVNGYVVDMFHFLFKIFGKDFPVYNIADIFITVGGIAFCLWLIFHKPEEEPAKASETPRGRIAPERREAKTPPEDYLTQLKKPVAIAQKDIERERAERAEQLAREREERREASRRAAAAGHAAPAHAAPSHAAPSRRAAPPSDARRAAAPSVPRRSERSASDDPFAEFYDTPAPRKPSAPRPAEPPRAAAPASAPRQAERRAPVSAPRQAENFAPAAAPRKPSAPKKDETAFSLEDILAEFSDK